MTPPTPRHHPLDPFPFPVEVARALRTPRQHLRALRAESNRTARALALRLGCLGWFDTPPGPRAA